MRVLIIAFSVLVMASGCAVKKVLVKNCEKLGQYVYECEEID